jgi:hypothetical protein
VEALLVQRLAVEAPAARVTGPLGPQPLELLAETWAALFGGEALEILADQARGATLQSVSAPTDVSEGGRKSPPAVKARNPRAAARG